jgi:Calcineurin-like phosphoesterase
MLMRSALFLSGCLLGTVVDCGSTQATCPGGPNCTTADAASVVDAAPYLGTDGGTQSSLYFAVVGDTRPPNEDETSSYPTAIITTIFSDLAMMQPSPPFVVSTGDYQYSNPTGTQSAAQLALYMAAKGSYTGIQFPAMGNHECTGSTDSNCGSGNTNGLTTNYNNFLSTMLAPIGQTLPYYVININAPDKSWTSKFVFVAANAWDSTQSAWFTQQMQVTTTYTFVVRHESADANTAPGVTPSESIMAMYPYTLAIVGHSHEYEHTSAHPREVIIGNGGAPLSTKQNYGYGIFTQRTDGAIQVDMYDYMTNTPDMSFRFAVNPDGSAAN